VHLSEIISVHLIIVQGIYYLQVIEKRNMPASSRKRGKGQARKAKSKAATATAVHEKDFKFQFISGKFICNHGQLIDAPLVCVAFVSEFFQTHTCQTDFLSMKISMERCYRRYPEAVNNSYNSSGWFKICSNCSGMCIICFVH